MQISDYVDKVVMTHDSDQCLIWPHSRQSKGYGQLRKDGQMCLAHRVVCEKRHGPPPTKLHQAAHSCGRGHEGCCNPKHIEWKTPAGNQQDRLKHGTDMRGSKHKLSRLDEDQVRAVLSAKGKKSQTELALQYGVSVGCIKNIHARRSWAWLEVSDEG